ncbi:MAG: carbamoyltransferase HypF [Pseudomonadota bacterium]
MVAPKSINTAKYKDANRLSIKVKGIVQGVGFRPFIYNLAHKYSIVGWVCNSSAGVEIEAEGNDHSLKGFINEINASPPILAHIEKVEVQDNLALQGYSRFEIRKSLREEGQFVPVSPDISICADCLKEMFDPADRRYLYPFINCTNCGPRFTIIKDVPYDRDKTTMSEFEMCLPCKTEYEDPMNRRFHAQPNACPQCGPEISLFDCAGEGVDCQDIVNETARLILQGFIIAIKGIGGYHLACDATNKQAVARLRGRKYREDKPFALMVESIEEIKFFCCLEREEESLLLDPKRPIVLLRKRGDSSLISEDVAPGNRYLGVMLPYSPLHYLILKEVKKPLVMTSGNISDEPIAYHDSYAMMRLNRIADYFLLHNREIYQRTDDTVARIFDGAPMMIRRSRGYVPLSITLPFSGVEVLACGAQLKNTFCLTRGNRAFLSHHIGDLDNLETLRSFEQGVEDFIRLFHLKPKVTCYDLHPDYLSTRYAMAQDGEKIGVQHHHAHLASCMGENDITDKVIGVIFDGSGYGEDGHIWGGEFLVGDFSSFERVAHLEYLPMAGGEKAIKEPYRMAFTYLLDSYVDDAFRVINSLNLKWDVERLHVFKQMTEKGINSPLTSSMGRLFDAVSAILGVKERINYEGQAAVELEMMASQGEEGEYPFELLDSMPLRIKVRGIINGVIDDLKTGIEKGIISARFHNTISTIVIQVCKRIREKAALNMVALSGGVFQNIRLLSLSVDRLKKNGFIVLTHHDVPPNDGGISLGQALVALKKLEE